MRRAGRLICDRLFAALSWGGAPLRRAVQGSDCTDVIEVTFSNSQHLALCSSQPHCWVTQVGGGAGETARGGRRRWQGYRARLMTVRPVQPSRLYGWNLLTHTQIPGHMYSTIQYMSSIFMLCLHYCFTEHSPVSLSLSWPTQLIMSFISFFVSSR